MLFGCGTKHSCYVFGSFSHPHRLGFGVIHSKELHPKRMSNRFSANRLACARWTGEVEGQAETRRVSLPQSPTAKDQRVVPQLRERLIQRAASLGGEHDVVKRTRGCQRFYNATGRATC